VLSNASSIVNPSRFPVATFALTTFSVDPVSIKKPAKVLPVATFDLTSLAAELTNWNPSLELEAVFATREFPLECSTEKASRMLLSAVFSIRRFSSEFRSLNP